MWRIDLQGHDLPGLAGLRCRRQGGESDDRGSGACGEHAVLVTGRRGDGRTPVLRKGVLLQPGQYRGRKYAGERLLPRCHLDPAQVHRILGNRGAHRDVRMQTVGVGRHSAHEPQRRRWPGREPIAKRCVWSMPQPGASRYRRAMPHQPYHPPRSFGSVCVAMVTPMHPDGTLDIPAAQRLARHLVSSGADALLLSGTTGESPTTHQPEKDELVTAVVEEIGDDAMIIAGAGSNDTAHAVRIAKAAERTGADGLLVVSPYYYRPSQEGVYRHMRAVVEATSLPAMLYDIPGRTGVAIGDEILDRFAEHPQIRAVKDATGKVAQGFDRMRRTGLQYYSGDDNLNLAWLVHGASGVLSVVGHLEAARYSEMVEAVDEGDLFR